MEKKLFTLSARFNFYSPETLEVVSSFDWNNVGSLNSLERMRITLQTSNPSFIVTMTIIETINPNYSPLTSNQDDK